MSASTATSSDIEVALEENICRFVYDPLQFVLFAFPWGEAGTALADESGPDEWQTEVLNLIGRELKSPSKPGAIRIAVRSGHGIGKSALIAWLILWMMSTRPEPQIVVTANTSDQLSSKTWRELAKWKNLSINSHWFTWTATKLVMARQPDTWFAHAMPWSKERSEAFAGTHAKHVAVIFDEASAIDDIIWQVSEGAMTGSGAGATLLWIVFGNPTRNSGRFFECFGVHRGRWHTFEIDSRTSKRSNKDEIKQWADDYGDDSDFFRVRVKGQAPRAGMRQLIASEDVELAAKREHASAVYHHAPIIVGVDVADFGDNKSVIYVRQGLVTLKMIKHRPRPGDKQWLMTYASLIAQEIDRYKADAVIIDAAGMGVGVADRLIQLNYDDLVFKAYVGSTARNEKLYFNLRTEIWCRMRDWLKDGSIPDDRELRDDLTGPEYGFSNREQLQLEKKDDMRKRGLASPDCGDALALTFAFDVQPRYISRELNVRGDYEVAGQKKWEPWAILKS